MHTHPCPHRHIHTRTHAAQGASPDEVALVEGSTALGFEMVRRPSNDTVLVRFAGVEAEVEVLNVMEFTSDRGRMSTIARGPDGTIRLFCKGSDAKVLSLVDPATPQDLLDAMHKNLHLFATQVRPAYLGCHCSAVRLAACRSALCVEDCVQGQLPCATCCTFLSHG